MKYRISRPAVADIDRIAAEGLDQFGPTQANKYLDGLHKAFQLLASFPRSNRERVELSPPQRIQPYGAHLVFYEIEAEVVIITRIRHGREDWHDD